MNDMKRNRRTRRLHSGLLLTGAVLAAMASGCSKSSDPTPTGLAAEIQISPAANDKALFVSPFDAVPSPDGSKVYFTAISKTYGPSVFTAGADGSNPALLASGLVSPFGITVSDDGATLFIADAGYETETEEGGMILTLPATGGTVTPLAGTEGTKPRGLEVQGDRLYYSGVTGKGKKRLPAVYSVGLAGGQPTMLVSGKPLKDPSGIAVTKAGEVYVLDTAAASTNHATVFSIKDGVATEFKTDIAVGYPGGIALSLDDTTLFVSALDDTTARDVVFVVNIASKETTEFTKSIDKFSESAGLHRARNAGVFAWADGQANKSGTVFVLK